MRWTLTHSQLSVSFPYFLLNHFTNRQVLKPDQSTAKLFSMPFSGKLLGGLNLGSLLRGAIGTEKWRHIWVGCSYQCASMVPADDDTGLMEPTQPEVVQRLLCLNDVWSLCIICV